jgi:hypothetical protein
VLWSDFENFVGIVTRWGGVRILGIEVMAWLILKTG